MSDQIFNASLHKTREALKDVIVREVSPLFEGCIIITIF